MSTLDDLRKLVEETSHLSGDTPLIIQVEYGYGCSIVVTKVEMDVTDFCDVDSEVERDVISFGGREDTRYSE